MRKYTKRELDRMIMIKPWEARMLMEEKKLRETVKQALIECGLNEEEIEEVMSNGSIRTEILDEKGKSILTFH